MQNWKLLNREEQLDELLAESFKNTVLIFKHSTTCGISHSAKSRLDKSFNELSDAASLYYLDLLAFRNVSNAVAQRLGVIHQSPQVIVVRDGEVVYTSSHYAIQPDKIVLG